MFAAKQTDRHERRFALLARGWMMVVMAIAFEIGLGETPIGQEIGGKRSSQAGKRREQKGLAEMPLAA